MIFILSLVYGSLEMAEKVISGAKMAVGTVLYSEKFFNKKEPE